MYYNTPDLNGHIRFIKKYRFMIIAAYIIAAISALIFFHPNFVSSDRLMWLEESAEFERTISRDYSALYVTKLELSVPQFDEKSKKELIDLHDLLSNMQMVNKVDSLFNHSYIYENRNGEDSSMVDATQIGSLKASVLPSLINPNDSLYSAFVDRDFRHFTYFIYSNEPIVIDQNVIPFGYEFTAITDAPYSVVWLFFYIGMGILLITILFRIIFSNYISTVAALVTVGFNIIGTFTIIWLITGFNQIYLAMLLLVSGVAMLDYLYFYYRWHVSHYKADEDRALLKSMNRNIIPALWTSVLTLLGLGSLLLIDSAIIQLLSLSLILASVLTYLFNITLLPALLSYFSVRHPKIGFGRYGYYFAKNEIHYNPTYLRTFLVFTSLVMAIGSYYLVLKPDSLFTHSMNEQIISVKVPYSEMDLQTISSLKKFEQDLRAQNEGISEVTSLITLLSKLNTANSGSEECTPQELMQALFYMELYNLENGYFDDTSLNITIHLDGGDKASIIRWLQNYKELDIYFTDFDSLISTAKMDKMFLLGASLLSVLILIGLIMGRIFRLKHLIWVGFITNAIPIIWFALFISIASIPLSLEVLIAMTLSVGLSSDATVHFAFKYFRSRYFGRTQRHALEVMFFYAGIPVIIGTLILSSVFALLTFTGIESLEQSNL